MRNKSRWTLGGLMVLIAVVSLPLVLCRGLIQKWRTDHELDVILMSIDRQVCKHPALDAEGKIPRPSDQKQGYFEYGDDERGSSR